MLVFCPITKPSINTVMILNCIHARWKLSMKHSKDRRTAISKKADSRLLASHIWVQLHYIILYSFGTGYALQQRIKMRKPRTQSLETVQIGMSNLKPTGCMQPGIAQCGPPHHGNQSALPSSPAQPQTHSHCSATTEH